MATASTDSASASASDDSVSGWTHFFTHISSFLVSCERQYGIANENFTEYAIEHLSVVSQGLNEVINVIQEENSSMLSEIEESLKELQQILRQALNLWLQYYENLNDHQHVSHYSAPMEPHNHGRGAPRFEITKAQLEYLRSLSFTWVKISKLLMVSRMTLYRRRVQYGLLTEPRLTMSDEELTNVVQRSIDEHPSVGQSFLWGVIRSQGYMVTRERVRRTLRHCDPIGTTLRWGGIATPRQPYSVPGPNSLWHVGKLHSYC